MTSPESDDRVLDSIRDLPYPARIDALLDAVNDTAEWQPAQHADTDGRAR